MDNRLKEERAKIDLIDREMAALFVERMNAAKRISAIKKENGLEIFAPMRENVVLENVSSLCGDRIGPYAVRLWETMLSLSREYQNEN